MKNNTASVTIYDENGLQSDGTGLVTDTLHLSFGSGLGEPAVITWYYNDTVAQAYTRSSGELTDALTYTPDGKICKDGDYYCVITNVNDQTFTSNTIKLVYDELGTEVSGFALADDYEGANITFDKADDKVVITAVMKKEYDGTFYIYEDGVLSFTNANYTNKAVLSEIGFIDATTFDKMTVKNVMDDDFKGTTLNDEGKIVTATNGDNALRFVAADGTTTLMWKIREASDDTKGSLTRGKSYKLAFDQKGIKTDDIGSTARTDVVVTASVAEDYLTAPAGLEIVSAAPGVAAKSKLVDEAGEALKWIGYKDSQIEGIDDEETLYNIEKFSNFGFNKFTVYGNEAASETDAKALISRGTIKKGEISSDAIAADDANSYYYTEIRTVAGVYGEKSETLKSGFKAANVDIVKEVTFKESTTDATQADIALKGVVAPATVYVVAVDDATSKGKFDPSNSATYRGSAAVKAGDGTAEVPGVFSNDDLYGKFYVVVVPENEDTYGRVTQVYSDPEKEEEWVLEPVASSMTITPTNDLDNPFNQLTKHDGASTTVIELNNLGRALNQFGEEILSCEEALDKKATVTPVDAGKIVEAGTGLFDVSDAGVVSARVNVSSVGVDAKDGFDVTILGSKFELRAFRTVADFSTDGDTASTADGDTKLFTVKCSGKTIATGEAGTKTLAAAKTTAETELADVKTANDNGAATKTTYDAMVTAIEDATAAVKAYTDLGGKTDDLTTTGKEYTQLTTAQTTIKGINDKIAAVSSTLTIASITTTEGTFASNNSAIKTAFETAIGADAKAYAYEGKCASTPADQKGPATFTVKFFDETEISVTVTAFTNKVTDLITNVADNDVFA